MDKYQSKLKSNFDDFEKLIKITAEYMIKNNITDLSCGPRTLGNHFERIVEEYFGFKCSQSQFILYNRWKKNINKIRDRVIELISYPEETKLVANQFYEFSIRFNAIEWVKILGLRSDTSRSKLLSNSVQYFNQKFKEKGINCWLRFKNNNFSTSKRDIPGHFYWTGSFECPNCESLLFSSIQKKEKIQNGVLVNVRWNGKNCSVPILRPQKRITGRIRENIKNEICSKGVTNFQTEDFLSGNDCKENISYNSVRKMRSEFNHRFQINNEFRIDSDAAKLVFDLVLPQTKKKGIQGFIHDIQSNPFGFILTSELQVKMWTIIQEKNPILYFDATGNIMLKFRNQNEILCYSMVAHDIITKSFVPIAEFYSTANDSCSITCNLYKILDKFKNYSFFKYPSVIVTDFSWANINGLIKTFNGCEVSHYLKILDQIIVKNDESFKPAIKTIVYICSTHFLKNIIDETDRILRFHEEKVSKLIKKVFLFAFSLLQNSNSLNEFCDILLTIQTIFNRKQKDNIVVQSLEKLRFYLTIRNIDFLKSFSRCYKRQKIKEKTFIFLDENASYTTSSPFTVYFENILSKNKVESHFDEEYSLPNIFFVPNLFAIIKSKLHLVPLWSGLIFAKFNLDFSRLSNNVVESWFKYYKNHILDVNKHVRNHRLLFTSEVTAPLYNYLNYRFRNFYEDRFNFLYQNNIKNNFFTEQEICKEQWKFKKPQKKIEEFYYQANDLPIKSEKDVSSCIDDLISFDSNFEEEEMELEEDPNEQKEIHVENMEISFDTNLDVSNLIYFKIDHFDLRNNAIKDLLSNQWLTSDIIQCFAHCIAKRLKKIKILIIDSYHITALFDVSQDPIHKYNFDKTDFITGFINENANHWTMVIIDLNKNEIIYLDPFGEKQEKLIKFKENWEKFCTKQEKLKNRKWLTKSVDHSIQRDNINCGVFVCIFFKRFFEKKNLFFECGPKDLEYNRFQINVCFKENSFNNFCSMCSAILTKDEYYLKSNCFHKYHYDCIKDFGSQSSNFLKCPQCF